MKRTIFDGSFASPGIVHGSDEHAGMFVGIHFGFSVTPEHQRGIKAMQEELGIPHKLIPENFGAKMHQSTKFPKDRFFFEKGHTHTCLTFESGVEPLKGWKNEELDNNPAQIAVAWDDKSFGIVLPNEYSGVLRELYDALEKKDVLVLFTLDKTYIYTHPVLWIGILSNINSKQKEKMFQAHVEAYAEENKQTMEI